jgi:hypothetical protein
MGWTASVGGRTPLTELSNVVAYLCRHSPIEDRHHVQIRTQYRRARFSRWPARRLGPTHACWRRRPPSIRLLSLRRRDARLRRSKRRRHQSADHFFALGLASTPETTGNDTYARSGARSSTTLVRVVALVPLDRPRGSRSDTQASACAFAISATHVPSTPPAALAA